MNENRGNPATAATPAGQRTALLINPTSFQASRGGLADAALKLVRRHGISYRTAIEPEGFNEAVDALLAESPRTLTVLGGDGTIHGVVTRIIESGRIDTAPALLLLGGGRTNVTAASVGTAWHCLDLLEQAVDGRLDNMPVVATPTLAVQAADIAPQYGFLLAGALAAEVIQDCHDWRSERPTFWRRSNAGTLWRLASQATRSMLGQSPYARPPMTIQAGALGTLQGPIRLLFISTLQNFGPVLDPFAARGEGALRLTVTRSDAREFWWRAPLLARGRFPEHLGPEQGYLSGHTHMCRIDGGARYCIDGQPLHTNAGQLTVAAGPPINLVQLRK